MCPGASLTIDASSADVRLGADYLHERIAVCCFYRVDEDKMQSNLGEKEADHARDLTFSKYSQLGPILVRHRQNLH